MFLSFNIRYYSYNFNSKDVNHILEVESVRESYSIVNDGKYKFLIYNENNTFEEGNVILFEGELIDIRNSYNSFYTYLNKQGVNYQIDYKSYEIKDDSVKLNKKIVNELLKNKDVKGGSYLKLILFNIKDDYNEDFYDSFSLFSLTYLIAVSGFHISILLKFFKKIFKKDIFGYISVGFYLYLLNFSVSSYRAFLCNIFKRINKRLGFDLSNIDIISLIGIVFIVLNPGSMFAYSFIFSFLSTFVLEIFKLYSKRSIAIGFYIYLVNMPVILLNYYKINLLSFGFSILISPLISFLYIFSFTYLFLDKFVYVYKIFIYLLGKIMGFAGKLNLTLIFGKPSVALIVLYYLLLICFFLHKERKSNFKYIYLLLIFVVLSYQYFKPCINSNEQFYFLNVGQGDCSVFMIPNSKKAVLIDTGGNKYKDIATSKIIPFLESNGINEIDKIIITHDDFDHNGALSSLIDNFKVSEVISDSSIDGVMIGKNRFVNLNISDKRDNEGSLVLLGKYGDYKLLLMGDASSAIEDEIVDKVGKIDIIKIGHHGSNDSSSDDFLRRIKGRIAIISVGKNNIYNHPHEDVIDRLKKYNYYILRTDLNNDIGFGKNIFGIGFIDYFN